MCFYSRSKEKLGYMITRDQMMQKMPYPLILDKKRSGGITIPSFNSSTSAIPSFKNNNFNSEPLNRNSNELSFKGSLHVKYYNEIKVTDAVKKFGEVFGESSKKFLDEKIQNASKIEGSGLKWDKDKDILSFNQKSMGRKILDILLYPIVKMPLDIANAVLKGLKKVFKNSKTIDKMLENPALKKRREIKKSASDVAAIEHYFEMLSKKTKKKLDPKTDKEIEVEFTDKDKDKDLFKSAHARFKPLLSNYDTTTERTLTRIITGMIPAFYLANDAYNLSMYMKNNKDDAEKDKKRRFNQETIRIGITAAFTFATMSIFAKKTNESQKFATALSAGVVLVSETVGRMISGTPVLPVGEKQAKRYSKIQDKMYTDKKKKEDDEKTESSDTFKGFEGKAQPKEYKKPPEKGNLTLKNVLKWMGILAVAGLGVDKASNFKPIKEFLGKQNKKYKALSEKEFIVSREEFNKLTDKLKENGFENVAENYKGIVKDQTGNQIKFDKVKDKTKDIIFNQIIAFPVRFAWDTLMTPYKYILKPALNMMDKNILKSIGIEATKKADDPKKKQMEMLRDSIGFLRKIDKEDKLKYQEKVNTSILSSLDNVTKSSYSNSDLASMTKIATSGVTSAFLIADNYNQVMIESKGQNKELAEQKAKERTLQRAIRITYSAFIIQLFNGVFKTTYNASLMGAQAVNIGNTAVIESLERKSVGLPIGESTREEIISEERKNLSATGIKGGYFRLMAKLTGKKSLSEVAIAKEKKEQKEKEKIKKLS